MIILIGACIEIIIKSQLFRNNSLVSINIWIKAHFFHAIQSNRINLPLEQTNILLNDFHPKTRGLFKSRTEIRYKYLRNQKTKLIVFQLIKSLLIHNAAFLLLINDFARFQKLLKMFTVKFNLFHYENYFGLNVHQEIIEQ